MGDTFQPESRPLTQQSKMADTEAQPLLRPTTAPAQPELPRNKRTSTFVGAAVAVVALVVVAVVVLVNTHHGVQRQVYSSAPVLMLLSTEKQVMLAKAGTIMYSSLPSSAVDTLFTEFKSTYLKDYPTDTEEETALKKFKKTLVNVDARNERDRAAGGRCVSFLRC
jgi:hypothetical protein